MDAATAEPDALALQHTLYLFNGGLRALLDGENDFLLQRACYATDGSVVRLGPQVFAARFAKLSPDFSRVRPADMKFPCHAHHGPSGLNPFNDSAPQFIRIGFWHVGYLATQ